MRSGQRTLVAVLAVLLQAACSPPRSIEALLVVADIAAGPDASQLKTTTEPPVRKTIRYAFEGHLYSADVYWPGGGDTAGAVNNGPRLLSTSHGAVTLAQQSERTAPGD